MHEVIEETSDPSVEEIPETAQHPDFDLILAHWPRIASTAWSGALTMGPSFIGLVILDAEIEFEYRPGSPCRCHPVGTDTYDPEHQVVVVVCRAQQVSLPMILAGWPTPPEAYAALTADGDDATVH
jgi:hypothetical protein